MNQEDTSLFEQLGGRPALERVHKIFYDKLYAHPWLKQFFREIDQKTIENQQTDFMTSNMGGGKIYSGQLPINAHKHLFVTQEMFDLRHQLLRESIQEAGVPGELMERWLRIDKAFEKSITKTDPVQCQKRFFTDEIVIVPKPF
ncbi:MAG: group 1 truncated hemoglobin [Nitrospinae bacterium]|nr:group 1 truncated hemoglobin [Nitrospinota bacterium]